MFKDKKIVALIPVLALTLLSGCGQEQGTTAEKISNQLSNKCSLDVVNGEAGLVVQTKTGKADFRGWAVDSNSNTTPEVLNVVLTSVEGVAYIFQGAQRGARPDVVKAYKQDAFLNSGFRISADVSSLTKGTYSVSLQMPLSNSVVMCKTKKVLLID
jgi:hypothetical protein